MKRFPSLPTVGIVLCIILSSGCVRHQAHPSRNPASTRPVPAVSYRAEGLASWYGGKFHGRKTASGERFDQNDFTCAHRTLPFGTLLRVENLDNGKATTVRVNDRGPAIQSRIIDVSRAAAKSLEMINTGTAHVRVVSGTSDPIDDKSVEKAMPDSGPSPELWDSTMIEAQGEIDYE